MSYEGIRPRDSAAAFMERQPRRRRRPALSCLECRRRKIKCDRSDPCAHCVSARSQCTYRIYGNDTGAQKQPRTHHGSPRRSTSTPSAYAPSPLAQAGPVSIGGPIPGHGTPGSWPPVAAMAAAAVAPEQQGTLDAFGRDDVQPPNRVSNSEPSILEILQRLEKLEGSSPASSSSIHGLSETGRHILARQTGVQSSQVIMNKTRTLRWSHWMGTAQEFETIVNCITAATKSAKVDSFQAPEAQAVCAEIADLLQKCKNIARGIKLSRPSRWLSYPVELAPPSRDVADAMAALYFRSFESTHRILHIPTFWTEYRRYWEAPESVSNGLRLKVLLVVAIGSSLSSHGDAATGLRNLVRQWVYAAEMWLSGPLEKDRLEIDGIQIHCLTILARQLFSIGGDLVWVSMGSLIHKAMQMGLNRDPKHLPPMPILQAERRRRLWATILELTVQSSLDSAMPPRISFQDFDTEAPSNCNDDEIDESTTTLQPHPKDTYTATSIQLLLLNSLPIRLRILHLLNDLRSELSYLDVLSLSSEVTEAYRTCAIFMNDHEQSGVTPFHRNLIDYLVRRFLIPLHCPFASQARSNPLFYYSLKTSMDASLAIISPERDGAFAHLMAIGGGLFREGIRYALAVISYELIAQTQAQSRDGTLHRDPHYRELLKSSMKDMIALSLERIQEGETNIKSHMFLSMIMAQVESIEQGLPRDVFELRIAQRGRDSLELCHEILGRQLSNVPSPSTSNAGLTPLNVNSNGQDGFGFDFDIEFFLPEGDLL
ncbi:hypothetical protein GGS23DRAFT_150109 [Durotheca rogersii]|uniref:uncharacterized protein n=1 Tax=Durotheca rogersii TaxID=419775 RepID=UPI00221E5D2C|nr:uncharacterized protein GGS23DRAFT_150109 [Durotheca rogersii]KAI5861414.1 hypothetical protein GGS23DRAFT_150109 [Durotheca rogersii]